MAQLSGGGPSRRGPPVPPIPGAHPHPPSSSHTHDLPYHWHDKQEVIQRELEEARARATQMEKTMRWWSDCTANWREKWSKVRSERNKAREEVRILRGKLEICQREAGLIRREKNDLETRIKLLNHQSPVSHNVLVDKEKFKLSEHCDSPERDNATPTNSSAINDIKKLSTEELHFISDANNTNFTLLQEMFGSKAAEELVRGVEDVAVYVHKAGEASKLSEKCRTGREVKDLICEDYLKPSVKDYSQTNSEKENDIEENSPEHTQLSPHHQDCLMDHGLPGSDTGLSGGQPSPSHRISAMSDPLPDTTCNGGSPRISAVSDPLSEICGTSECSETGYAESIRSSECGVSVRRWRNSSSAIPNSVLDDSGMTPEQESLEQQLTMLKLRLEEATKTIQAERDEKMVLHRDSSRWQADSQELRSRLEDTKASRQEAMKELVALRTLHQKEVQSLQMEMLDEASSRECVDRRLADLRAELERLQEENASEWGRRERLESEKLSLERENKKLKSQVEDLEERLDKRTKILNASSDADVVSIKQELTDKTKELSELKHSHSKLKKVLSDKCVELQHSNRRADQYENEVKRLRSRVDELKKELAAAEDEVDTASNSIRKLQRSNDEFQENVENLEVQVEHLQSRLRSSQNSSAHPLRSTNLLADSDDSQF